MLTPEYLDGIAGLLQVIYSDLQETIQKDIARRIGKANLKITETAKWQIFKLQELGESQQNIQAAVAKALKLGDQEVKALFKTAGIKSLKTDIDLQKAAIAAGKLPAGTIPLSASPTIAQVLNANAVRTMNTLRKLTGTIAVDASGKLNQYLDQAQMMVQTGAFTEQQAADAAVRKFAADGVSYFGYPSGARMTVEAAVRRAVVTGVNQATAEVSLNNAAELETDLVEVTSHSDARPEHAAWQGKIYSLSGNSKKYRKLSEATGYGTVTGLCGANCRHSFYAYIEGVSEQVPREEYDKATYKAEQEQRYNERMIRSWKRRAATLEAGGADNTKELLKVREWQTRLKDHLDSTGLARQSAREQVPGYSRSMAQRAVQAGKKQAQASHYLNNIKPNLPRTAKTADTKLQHSLSYIAVSEKGPVEGIIPSGAIMRHVVIMAGYGTKTDFRNANDFAKKYGGEYWMWKKSAGTIETAYRKYEIHWNEYNGVQYEPKVKGVIEK